MTLLVATAVEAEAAVLRPVLGDAVVAVGVGPAAAAAGTARILALAEAAGRPYRAVVSAGIAGGFPGRGEIGGLVIGARSIAADLGADSPAGFLPIDSLGFGSSTVDADAGLLARLCAALPRAVVGDVLTVSTVTGTREGAATLGERHRAAVAEAMEGFGVSVAAAQGGLPFVELRAVSNAIGPRDRSAWRIGDALAALGSAAPALAAL